MNQKSPCKRLNMLCAKRFGFYQVTRVLNPVQLQPTMQVRVVTFRSTYSVLAIFSSVPAYLEYTTFSPFCVPQAHQSRIHSTVRHHTWCSLILSALCTLHCALYTARSGPWVRFIQPAPTTTSTALPHIVCSQGRHLDSLGAARSSNLALRGLLLRAAGQQDAASRLLLAHIDLDQHAVPHRRHRLELHPEHATLGPSNML